MGDVPAHDDFAGQLQTGGHRILAEMARMSSMGWFRSMATASSSAPGFGQKACRVGFQLLQENAVGGDFGLDVAVRAAADADADGTGGAMARQAHHANVVAEIFAAELGADAQASGPRQQFFFQFKVPEAMAGLAAGSGQVSR
jgi:hypothetical protein